MTGAPEAQARLRRVLSPGSVAILGASPRPESLSRRFLSGLVRHGFAGTIVAVNPNYDEVDGIRCVPSVGVAGAIDLAVLSVPKRLVLSSLEECAAAGVAGAVVFASGYSETGDRGREDELEITALARRTGLRVLGPNSPGLIDLTHSCCVIASGVGFRERLFPGGVAVIAQSGGVAGLLTERAQDRGIGISSVVCTGNESDVKVGEIMTAFAADEATRVVAVFLEGVRDGAGFTAGLDALRLAGKTAVVLKVGAAGAAARASAAHTGALVTDADSSRLSWRATGHSPYSRSTISSTWRPRSSATARRARRRWGSSPRREAPVSSPRRRRRGPASSFRPSQSRPGWRWPRPCPTSRPSPTPPT